MKEEDLRGGVHIRVSYCQAVQPDHTGSWSCLLRVPVHFCRQTLTDLHVACNSGGVLWKVLDELFQGGERGRRIRNELGRLKANDWTILG